MDAFSFILCPFLDKTCFICNKMQTNVSLLPPKLGKRNDVVDTFQTEGDIKAHQQDVSRKVGAWKSRQICDERREKRWSQGWRRKYINSSVHVWRGPS